MTRALLLLLLACGPGPEDVGATCDHDDDCAFGECYTEAERGYCTAECDTEGSTAECPEYTVCKRIEGGPARCLLVCDDDRDCPGNSECNDVPGADGLRGCEPVR